MKLVDVFGFLMILLAIYLAVNATARGDVGDDLFDGAGRDDRVAEPDRDDEPVEGGKLSADDEPDGNEGIVTRSDFCANLPENSRFDDLGDKHDEAIRCMEAAGVVSGQTSDTYAPRDALTRAEAASTIAAMIRSSNQLERSGVNLRSLPEAPQTRFVDVPPDSPHADAIARLNEAGIIEGYVDSRYEPQGRVSRAQMASIIDRTYKYMTGAALPGGSDQFSDDDRSVHEDSINAVGEADIMDSTIGVQFDPNRSVRRGLMATIAARTMIRLEQTERITPLN
jgi:hypothetical protein